MMAKTKEEIAGLKTISPMDISFVDGPQYSAFYSNNINFQVNLLDFVLVFGEIIDATPEKAIVERKARVTLNPIQAKIMALLLLQNIQKYEQMHGDLKLPEGALNIIEQASKS
jgi:hypothetical protein